MPILARTFILLLLSYLPVNTLAAVAPAFPAPLPASYEREVPGANSLIRWHLDLLHEGRYRLRLTYLDKPQPNQFDQSGRWRYEHKEIVLFQDREPPWRFRVEANGDTLRQLDSNGKRIDSIFDAPLKRLPQPALIEPRPPTDKPLRGTDWELVQLEGKSVTATDRGQTPHLSFSAEEQRAFGSGGCNRIMGGFELEGDRLRLPRMASTMMACASGMDQEYRFLQALGRVERFHLDGNHLEMQDTAGTVLMRFEARTLIGQQSDGQP